MFVCVRVWRIQSYEHIRDDDDDDEDKNNERNRETNNQMTNMDCYTTHEEQENNDITFSVCSRRDRLRVGHQDLRL